MNASRWAPYIPTDTEPWTLRRVVHVHRRAGFGAAWSELQRGLNEKPETIVDRLLQRHGQSTGVPENFESMAQVIGDAAVSSANPQRLQAWWVYRMLFSPDPLAERLTLMWHNHFATSNRKVDDVRLMREQNDLFRQYGRGPFGDLLRRVVKHPALLIWLDADANRREHPNENLARELMELFTLGVGNFSESDVKEAARALTGWTVVNGEFRTVPEYHDDREKTILGHTGEFDGDDLLDLLLEHPATARRLAWRLCRELMGEDFVSEDLLGSLADGLREHDLDIGWAVATILKSGPFFAAENIGNRVLSPVEFVAGAVRALEMFAPPPSTLVLAEWIARLGQDLFYPPNVFGWDGGRTWITTRSMIGRTNFAAALAAGKLRHPPAPPDVLALADRHGCSRNREQLISFLIRLLFGTTPADSREPVEAAVSDIDEMTPESARRIVAVALALPQAQFG